MTSKDLANFETRLDLVAWLRTGIPFLAAEDTALSLIRGGRAAALTALERVDPQAYERSRNFLSGTVTRLSPYLRHGVLTLAEVRDFALAKVRNPDQTGKLINEFAWRDYWQRLYFQMGEGVWQDREGYKTGFPSSSYGSTMPAAVTNGTTTLSCIDSFSRELKQTGYLHNHARMWTAAYLVHWLRVRWQAGAHWFLEHLLDGDPASNNLSWQWVASTFSSKPYLFNRENLERYTGGIYCKECPHARAKTCPFDATYEELTDRLFPRLTDASSQPEAPRATQTSLSASFGKPSSNTAVNPLIWIHTDSLNPVLPAFAKWPNSPAVFIWDTEWLAGEKISLKRIVFIAECLAEMPGHVEIRFGDPATEVLAAAKLSGADSIVTQNTPDPRLLQAARRLQESLPVFQTEPPPFVEGSRAFDLKRFSRYWQRAQSSAMQATRG